MLSRWGSAWTTRTVAPSSTRAAQSKQTARRTRPVYTHHHYTLVPQVGAGINQRVVQLMGPRTQLAAKRTRPVNLSAFFQIQVCAPVTTKSADPSRAIAITIALHYLREGLLPAASPIAITTRPAGIHALFSFQTAHAKPACARTDRRAAPVTCTFQTGQRTKTTARATRPVRTHASRACPKQTGRVHKANAVRNRPQALGWNAARAHHSAVSAARPAPSGMAPRASRPWTVCSKPARPRVRASNSHVNRRQRPVPVALLVACPCLAKQTKRVTVPRADSRSRDDILTTPA